MAEGSLCKSAQRKGIDRMASWHPCPAYHARVYAITREPPPEGAQESLWACESLWGLVPSVNHSFVPTSSQQESSGHPLCARHRSAYEGYTNEQNKKFLPSEILYFSAGITAAEKKQESGIKCARGRVVFQ